MRWMVHARPALLGRATCSPGCLATMPQTCVQLLGMLGLLSFCPSEALKVPWYCLLAFLI